VQHDDESESSGFLPPQPPGPEPELGARPAQPPSPPAPPQSPQAPAPQQTYGYPPPPPGYVPPPPSPPPGYAPPPAPGWGYQQAAVPDNGQAVAGFVFSVVSVGLLVLSAGLSTIVSLGCAITGLVCSRKGKRKVDAGETPKHRGLAQAGLIVGWVGLGLSILAIAAWTYVFVFETNWDDINIDPEETRSALARVF
jgi:hypothetical protein